MDSTFLGAGVLLSCGFDFHILTVLFLNTSQHVLSSLKPSRGVDLQGQQHEVRMAEIKKVGW